ncbi:MAG: hypothetical protein P8X95_01765 [Anaerolineales bacterium]|jgi:hypothetical protein
MKHSHSPGITSFVIRFVYAESTPSPKTNGAGHTAYRGAIRHIQTDQEIAFSSWREAVEFMRRFVPLELDD